MSHLPAWLNSVYHCGASPYVSTVYPALSDTITIRLRASAESPIRRVFLRTYPDGEQIFVEMNSAESTTTIQWFTGDLHIRNTLTHYRFLIEADDGMWWYTATGGQIQEPLDAFNFRIIADYDAPSWLHESVFYQIFPDRFANGDPSTNVKDGEFDYQGASPKTFAWGEPPDDETEFPVVFYGGDLTGVTHKLDYIQGLGINAIYFNPIFTAPSNHKYDVTDYGNIDEHFGGNQALADLSMALRQRNMRYMLDIVPNHCGYWHIWFQAARADQNSAEASYFTFYNNIDEYENWLGIWSLPKLNYQSSALREAMYEGEDSIIKKWLKPPYSADAWRVDVANMLGRQKEIEVGSKVAQGIRKAIKSISPDAWLLGENFFDATAQLQGDQYDSIMNYSGFTKPIIHWLTRYRIQSWGMSEAVISAAPYSTAAMLTTMQERIAVIPWQIALQQYNLLGSHDTPRIRSLLDGNDDLVRLAVTLLLTWPGVPCIYYGDEIGLFDDVHLDQRGCMPWQEDAWDQEILAFYKDLIELRRSAECLKTGSLQVIDSGENWFAYTRSSGDTAMLIVANRGAALSNISVDFSATALPDGSIFTERHSGVEVGVFGRKLTLPHLATGATILIRTGAGVEPASAPS